MKWLTNVQSTAIIKDFKLFEFFFLFLRDFIITNGYLATNEMKQSEVFAVKF